MMTRGDLPPRPRQCQEAAGARDRPVEWAVVAVFFDAMGVGLHFGDAACDVLITVFCVLSRFVVAVVVVVPTGHEV